MANNPGPSNTVDHASTSNQEQESESRIYQIVCKAGIQLEAEIDQGAGTARRAEIDRSAANSIKSGLPNVIDYQHQDDQNKTALHLAATRGFTQVVEKLVRLHANIDLQDDDGNTPLNKACENGKEEVARILLAPNIHTNASVTMPNNEGWYPLHWSSLLGLQHTVTLLLSRDIGPLDKQDRV